MARTIRKNASDKDRSLANIHTGDRAGHQAVHMPHEAGSLPPPAEATPAHPLGPGGKVSAHEPAPADHTGATAGSLSAASHADVAPAEGRQQIGANSVIPHGAVPVGELGHHLAAASAPGAQGASAHEVAPAGGGGGGGASHANDAHATNGPVLHAPTLAVSAVVGEENHAIALDIRAALVDAGRPELLSVTVTGLPGGAIMSAGIHNADGTWTLTGDQLVGLSFTPAPNSSEDFTLVVTATARDAVTGLGASVAATVQVQVVETAVLPHDPVVHAPALTVSAAIGAENGNIPLIIAVGLTDHDHAEVFSVAIAGLPEGATLSAGVHNLDGTWTLSGDQLAGLTLTPAPNSGEDFTLTVTAVAHDSVTGVEAHATTQLPVTVIDSVAIPSPEPIPAVTAPRLAVSAAVGAENGTIPLAITAGLVDFAGNESLTVTIAGLPAGAALSAGAHNPDGSWTLTNDQLAGLTLTPAADSGEDFTLTVTATAYDAATGVEAHATTQLPVTVIDTVSLPSPEPIPSVTAPSLAVSAAVGAENGTIPLAITAGLVDLAGNENLTVTIAGLPEGASLSAGIHNPDGTWTLSGDQLAGLTLTPAPDSGEDFTLTVTATAHDNVTGVDAHATTQLPVTVIDAVSVLSPEPIQAVTAPSLAVTAAVGAENGAIPLVIDAGLVDLAGNENLTVTIAGLPEGAALSAGIHNSDGTWTLSGDELAGLTLTPVPNSGEDFTLTVTATAHDGVTGVEAHATTQLPVTVIDQVTVPSPEPIASVAAPSLAVSAAVGAENGTIPLVIDAGLVDLTGNENLTVTVAGLPEGASLSAGIHNSDGSWMLTGDELAGLTLTPASNSGEDFTLTVTATAHDNITGVEAHATTQLPVTVIDQVTVPTPEPIPSVTPPSLAVSAAAVAENGTIPLAIAAGLADLAGNESLTVTIAGLPEGASLSSGIHNPDGTWTLSGDQLAGLTLTPALDSGEDLTLTITATAHDSSTGVEARAIAQLPVTVIDQVIVPTPEPIPSVTAPSLAVSAAVGAENGTIPLAITAGLVDLGSNESLTVTIAGLPEGAALSAGVLNSDGSWTLSGGQLVGLTLTPAPDSSEDFTLTVTAAGHDTVTGVDARATTQLPVTVIDQVTVPSPEAIPSVTAPSLAVSAAVGAENGTIPLAITAGLADLAGNEALTVNIAGLPESASLSAGVHNPDGTWTLSGDQLAGLTLTPAPNSGEDFTLTVTATAHDSVTGMEAQATTQLPVTVIDQVIVPTPEPIPSVTAPSLAVSAAVGAENGVIPLAITAGLADLASNESLSVTIAGLPEGAALSAGVHNSDGTWMLNGDQLAELTLTPAPNSGADFTLTVTATAHDSITGVEAHATTQLPVTVIDTVSLPSPDPIPSVTAPSLAVSAAVGAENGAIPLAITAGLVDLAGNESLTVTIAGLPEDATLSAGVHNSDGTWTLSGDQLTGLTLTPAPDSGEDFILTVTASAHDGITGVEAHATTQLPVTVIDEVTIPSPESIPSVTAPSLAVSAAVGAENGTIPLAITAGVVDLAGNENLTVTIAGLPEGATLSAGVHNLDGTWTLTSGQLAGLTLTPAPDSGIDFTLTVTATAHDSITGVEAHATTQLPVTVIDSVSVPSPEPIPSVTAPSLTVSAAVGAENGTIPLVIDAGLAGLAGNESLTVTIAGLPEGATLSGGVHNSDGTWTLGGDQLVGLTLTPVPDSGEDFTLTVTATAHDSITGVEAHATTQLPVTVIDSVTMPSPEPIASVAAPSLAVTAAVGAENGAIPLAITAGLADLAGNENLTVTIAGLPEGATLSAGVHNLDGTWTLSGDQLAGLTLTPALDSGEDFTLTVTATAHDSVTGVEAYATTQLPVTVIDQVTVPTPEPIHSVTVPSLAVSAAVGTENGTIPLAITAGLLDLAGNESLMVTIAGLPAGAALSAGVHNPDGTWILTGDQLAGLTLTPAPNSGEDFTLTVTATAHDSSTGVEAHATTQLPVTVIDPVSLPSPEPIPSVTAPTLAVFAAIGAENGTIPLAITAGLVDVAANESLTVTIAGLPGGAALSAGVHNPDGSWTLSNSQLAGLTLTPAADSGEDFTLTITATAYDATTGMEAHATTQLPVTVIDTVSLPSPEPIPSVAAPSLAVSAAVGAENGAIPLAITAGLVDLASNEDLTVTIAGLPEGASLSAGTHNPDGTWTLSGDQLAGLTLTPAPDSGEDFTLTVTATAHDSITGIEAQATTQLPVTVIDQVTAPTPEPIPSVTAPSLTVSAAVGAENGTIPLAITTGLADLTGNESLTVTIAGLPEGATLSGGVHNSDGTWTLNGDQLAGLTLTPAPNSGEDFTLTVTATAHDGVTGVEAHATAQLPVTVIDQVIVPTPEPIASVTAPSLAVSAAVGAENGAFPLAITAGLADLAGNEALTITIAGLSEGAFLSAGTHNPDGTWTLSGDQLAGLTLTPAADSGEDFTLTVTATAHDNITGLEAHATTQLPVTVIDQVTVPTPEPIPSVTAPNLAVSAAVGAENGAIPLAITTGLADLAGNESLTVTIVGLPEGASLSAGVHNPDGSWTLSGEQLAGLTLTPALDSGEDFTLTVTATAHDSVTGVEAHATTQLPVTVIDQVIVPSPEPIPSVTAPSLAVSAAVGAENGAIPLAITAGLADLAGNEALTITIAGLSEGAFLSAGTHNPDGTWTLSGDQLAGLTLTPAPDSGEDFTLTVTATAHDSIAGIEAHATTQLPVTVIDQVTVPTPESIPSVTAPSLAVSAAVGAENGTIPLAITTGLADLTGNESLTVTIAGLPEGATLSGGVHNSDGTWTLNGDQLAGLTLTPAPNSGEDFTLTVTATAHDGVTGVEAHATTQLPVTVIDQVTPPSLEPIPSVTAPSLAVSAAVGAENGAIPLAITAGLVDLAGNEALTVTIAGLPEGASLSAGTHNPDGTWTLGGDQLAGLTLTPAPDSGEDFTLTITATALDAATGVETHAIAQLPVTVIDQVIVPTPESIPSITAPSLAVTAAVGAENGTIPLAITAGLADLAGNESLPVTVVGLPEGAALSVGVHNPDGSWTLSGDQLAGLTLTPAPNSGEDFTLTVTAVAHAVAQLPVTVVDSAIVPELLPIPNVPGVLVTTAAGLADQPIPLDITPVLAGVDVSGELLVAIGNLPAGAMLSAGAAAPDGAWIVAADQLEGLTLTAPPNVSGSLTLSVTPIEVGADEVALAGTAVPLVIEVHGVAAPMLVAEAVTGLENLPIALNITAAIADAVVGETLSVTITGLPEGAMLSAGASHPDGSWTLAGDQLTGLTLTPAPDSSEGFTLTVTAAAHDGVTGIDATTTAHLPVTIIDATGVHAPVVPMLEVPSLEVSAAIGAENSAIPLDIAAGLTHLAGTESLSVTIAGLPEGAILSAGIHNPDGSWLLSADQLTGLTLTPVANSGEDFSLTVTATAHDHLTGAEAIATADLPVTVADHGPTTEVSLVPSVDLSPVTTDPSATGAPAGSAHDAGTLDPSVPLAGTVDVMTGSTTSVLTDSAGSAAAGSMSPSVVADAGTNPAVTSNQSPTAIAASASVDTTAPIGDPIVVTSDSLPIVSDGPSLVPAIDASAALDGTGSAGPATTPGTPSTSMSDAEFVSALEQLSVPTSDISHIVGSVLDPVATTGTLSTGALADATSTIWGPAETAVTHDATAAPEPTPPPPPSDPVVTVSFSSPAHL